MHNSILSVGLISLVSVWLAEANEGAWKEFKEKFDKNYKDPEQESHRRRVFEENLRYIESHNLKSGSSFMQGINPLSDLTTQEINDSRNGFRMPENPQRLPLDGALETLLLAMNHTIHQQRGDMSADDKAWYEDILSPQSLDFRPQGRVSKVKDQGSCGSCWAFATTGALESLLAAQNRSTLFSEQNLVDCSRRYGNHGCSGGLMDAALRYVRDHGIMSSQDYPYAARDNPCKFDRSKSVTRVRGSAILPRGNEALLRLALSLVGPLPVAIDAGLRSFHNYKSGVFNDDSCKSRNLNHAVLLVGYGSDKTGGDYWIIKNSWGNKWGDNGYIKMARNRGNLCGIASYAVLPIT